MYIGTTGLVLEEADLHTQLDTTSFVGLGHREAHAAWSNIPSEYLDIES